MPAGVAMYMQLVLHTIVQGNYREVLGRFNQDLFVYLAPAFPAFTLLRFDGSSPGDVVEVQLSAAGFSVLWSARIIERQITGTEAWFTDHGEKLPWPLKKWQHRHLVTRLSENKSRITDEIYFSTGFLLADWLLFPVLRYQFANRVPKYKSWFGR